ncbi:glycosyltransferase [Polynucleobacter sp. AM-7D1]|nr:glycosyltransferase [Polynucleobacter sp. AM-7D1]
MAVYNPIEYDGRVKRSANALAEICNIKVICPAQDFSSDCFNPDAFDVMRVLSPKIKIQALKQIFFWVNFIFQAIKLRPSIIYAHDYYLIFPAWLAAFMTNAYLVYDAHELIIPNQGERISKRDNFFYFLESRFIKSADLVIAANQERANIMGEHYELKKIPLVVRNIPPMPKQTLSDKLVFRLYEKLEHEYQEDIHIIYMGDINLDRGIGDLINSLKYLPMRYKCILIGGGPSESLIKLSHSQDIIGKRLRLLGPVPHNHIPDLLRQGDIGFLSYSMVGRNNIYCAPNKIYEYAQSGLPIISTSQEPIVSILRKYKIGELLPIKDKNTPLKIAEYIKKISFSNEYKHAIRKFLLDNPHKSEMDKLKDAINGVIN